MGRTVAETTARAPLRAGLLVAVLALAQFDGVAFGQEAMPPATHAFYATERPPLPITITTPTLGMTGWWPDPVITTTTPTLGMTGWQRDPVTITAPTLGMTGWQRGPLIVTAPMLAMTGWQRDPVTVTASALGMTGWASAPERCSAPFVHDSTGEECVCPPGLLPSGDACVAAEAAPPSDLRIEKQGPDACAAGEACPFDILVTNVGAGPFQGPLVVRNDVNLSGSQLSTTSSGWSCAAGTCVHPEVTLAPGGSEALAVNLLVPASADQDVRLRQCAELTTPEPDDAPVGFVQLMLRAAGIDAGPVDNQMGQRTRGGIEIFRRSVGLPNGSDIDEPLIAALRDLIPADPHPENDRNCTEARVTG